MKALSYAHLVLGIFVLVHFVVTGQLMKYNYFSITEQNTLLRMMLRANHIYILFVSLVHLLLFFILENKPIIFLNLIASFILIIATIFLNVSFYFDTLEHVAHTSINLGRVMTNYSVKGVLLGLGIHLLIFFFQKKYFAKQ